MRLSRGRRNSSREANQISLLTKLALLMQIMAELAQSTPCSVLYDEEAQAEYWASKEQYEWKTFEATAYTARCEGCTGITKTGYDVRHTIYAEDGRRIIAVDPSVIPLGSTVEVRLADGRTFEAVALDIGGAIKGERIDILVDTEKSAFQFGRQDVEVRVIEEESE